MVQPAPAWISMLSPVTSWITSVEKFMHRPALAEVHLPVVLPGDPHHERAQRLGEHVHAVELELDHLLLDQRSAALPACAGVRHGHLAGVVAHAERVGGELEVAEQIAAGAVAGLIGLHVGAVDLADHVGVRHARVLEDHLAVLVEAPAALVEHLADAEARRVARHQEHGGALLERRVRVGARVDEEQLADAGVGDEAFLAVEDPVVAVALGAQLQAGLGIVRRRQAVVGAGVRLVMPLPRR